MSTDQTCEIVRDLLSSLHKGLTSEKTTMWVMEHLDACPECKEKYDILYEMEPAGSYKPSRQELDRDVKYLRKRKKRLFITIPVAVICACSILLTGYYFLFVKKFFVPTRAMIVSFEQDFPDSTCHCDITLSERYSVAVKEDDEILYIKDSKSGNHVDYSIRYSYFLWDYFFPGTHTKTEHLLISNDFVGEEYPGLSMLNTPARLLLKGNSEADSKVLWNSMELVPAARAIADRFINADNAYDPSKTEKLKAVYETTEMILGPIEEGSGFGISPWLAAGTASEELALRDIYILLRNMNLSDNDLVTLKDSAVLLLSTTETTASKISNNDSSAPDEKVTIIRIGLYTMPDVQMEAKSIIETQYVGIGYHFGLNDGKWIFEKTGDGSVTGNAGGNFSYQIIVKKEGSEK